jgi:uncharacterized protein (TIGR02118 family)
MKTKISILLLTLSFCWVSGQEELSENPQIEEGMIKVAIFYENGVGKTFDMDYYANKHMPMAASLFGDALKAMVIDKGIANGTPDMPLKYVAIGYFYFNNMDAFKNAMGPNSPKLKADVSNYTNIIPQLQISEVQTVQ